MQHRNLLVGLVLLCFSTHGFASCLHKGVALQVLGSGGPELDDDRNSSGYLIWVNGKSRLLVDAGSGTSVAFGEANGRFEELQAILLTHLHVDHAQDLPAFVKGSFFTSRQQNLLVMGPDGNRRMPATTEFIERLFGKDGAFPYLNDYIDAEQQNDYHLIGKNMPLTRGEVTRYAVDKDITVSATAVHHGPIAAVAWKVDVGGCTMVFSGDLSNEYDVLENFAAGADLLIANTAVPEHAGVAAKNLHMTPFEIAQIAKQAKVKKLLLSHFMKRTLSNQQAIYKAITEQYLGSVILAEDGMNIRL